MPANAHGDFSVLRPKDHLGTFQMALALAAIEACLIPLDEMFILDGPGLEINEKRLLEKTSSCAPTRPALAVTIFCTGHTSQVTASRCPSPVTTAELTAECRPGSAASRACHTSYGCSPNRVRPPARRLRRGRRPSPCCGGPSQTSAAW